MRTPMAKPVVVYPRVEVHRDSKVEPPCDHYALIMFRGKGITIESWRMRRADAISWATDMQTKLRANHDASEG